ncbi:MAG: GNAT family N-acetyltransferase [Anaerolineae bacterium]|nr:GNAT family N-acetyltransferase [Anaerolineae bacterium]
MDVPWRIQHDVRAEADLERLAEMVYDGFARKYAAARLSRSAAVELFRHATEPQMALCAYWDDVLVGLLGMVTAERRFLHVPWRRLRARFGLLGGLFYHLILNVQHPPPPGALLIAPLVVAPEARGRGIGRALMEAVERYAYEQGYSRLVLNVVDSNHAARYLYASQGFSVVKSRHYGWLTRSAGFTGADAMEKRLLRVT